VGKTSEGGGKKLLSLLNVRICVKAPRKASTHTHWLKENGGVKGKRTAEHHGLLTISVRSKKDRSKRERTPTTANLPFVLWRSTYGESLALDRKR